MERKGERQTPEQEVGSEERRLVAEMVSKFPFLGDEEEVVERVKKGEGLHDAAGKALNSLKAHLAT